MRLRAATLGTTFGAAALLAIPGLAGAAPSHNRGLTINATPNPVQAGQGVLIYGQLQGAGDRDQPIVLYHHVNGTHRGFSLIGRTTTDAQGYYDFTREVGVVDTNRQWFVRLAGDPRVHSRTVSEKVYADLSISAAGATATTRHRVVFTGHVTPDHSGDRVYLQEQVGGDDWATIDSARVGPGSDYRIAHSWQTPGEHVVRVTLPTDDRNLAGHSDTVDVTIQQAQHRSFTISTPSSTIVYGASDTITGALFAAGSSTTPQPNTAVTLCHGNSIGHETICDQAGSTGAGGSYSFSVTPTRNQWYFVKTTLAPNRRTANLFIGVHDAITLSASGSNLVGQPDVFSGTATPTRAGDFVLLQRREADGEFHDVGLGRVQADGSYSISHTFGTAGTKVFRTRILADGVNLGATSALVTVTVTLPPVASLTPAS